VSAPAPTSQELSSAIDATAAIGVRQRSGFRGKRPIFRREERHEFRYLLSVLCAIICSWIARLAPESIRYWCADRLGDLYFRSAPSYRDNVSGNVRQILGERASEQLVLQTTRSVFRTSARNFADLLLVPHRAEGEHNRRTQIVRGDYGHLDEALGEGRGALILSGHLGAFDLMGQVLHERGYNLTIVTGRTTGRFLFDAVTYLRRASGLELVEATPSGVKRAIQTIRRGGCAVFVSDRDFFQNGREVTFFGRRTSLPPGIVRIARETGAPVVPVFGERIGRGLGITVDSGFKVAKTGNAEADLQAGIEMVAAVLERAISRLPDQWVMFQPVWPSEPGGLILGAPAGSAPATADA
jgi:lauroyl/myristoyl acyltransferase